MSSTPSSDNNTPSTFNAEESIASLSNAFSKSLSIPKPIKRTIKLKEAFWNNIDAKEECFLEAKVLATDTTNWHKYLKEIKRAFSSVTGVSLKHTGGLTYLTEFNTNEDLEKIWNRSPWVINRSLANKETFLYLMNEIGDVILDSCSVINEGGDSFGRAKVWVPVDEALTSYLESQNPKNGRTITAILKYEKAGQIFFLCGRLGHQQLECEIFQGEQKPFNMLEGLKATPLNPWKSPAEPERRTYKGNMGSRARNLIHELDESIMEKELIARKDEEKSVHKGNNLAARAEAPPSFANTNLSTNGKDGSLWDAAPEGGNTFSSIIFSPPVNCTVAIPGIQQGTAGTIRKVLLNFQNPCAPIRCTEDTAAPIRQRPKRKGPGPEWHRTKESLGWNDPKITRDMGNTPTDQTSEKSSEFSGDSPSRWLQLSDVDSSPTLTSPPDEAYDTGSNESNYVGHKRAATEGKVTGRRVSLGERTDD